MNSISALVIVTFIIFLSLAGLGENKQTEPETGSDITGVFLYDNKLDSLVVLKYDIGLINGLRPWLQNFWWQIRLFSRNKNKRCKESNIRCKIFLH